MSLVTATITTLQGRACEGCLVALWAELPVLGTTDAGGVVTLDVLPAISYRLVLETAQQVDGVPYMAGTVLTITVPPAADPDPESGVPAVAAPIPLGACVTAVLDAGPLALLDRLTALEAAVAALTPAEPEVP